ncbi:MAG: rRNA ((527)-N(7))-methyltransferase RsmG [Actinomycetia bacterium]|jgi:16S rRNA (guanine527-N7)-methyltransferase|nr:rRNA ((527)-N(7))-methyltransferase RsmG [Actinomycetes bacterium]
MFHVKHEGWTVADLSPGQVAALEAFEGLLADHAIPRGMVSSSDRAHLRARHVLDSLRAVPHLGPAKQPVIDLGSGAGLPGIPVAVARPDLLLTLTEPRQLRAAFLELVVERLSLPNVLVFPKPAEELPSDAEMCLARGFGNPSRTWAVARRLLPPDGSLIYWAGTTFRSDQVPEDARIAAIESPTLESGGPIVIMTRQ